MLNFDDQINRINSSSLKWDNTKKRFGHDNLLPMWIADMDFKAPEPVLHAIQDRISHGIFGYTDVSTEAVDAILQWYETRHETTLQREWLTYSPSVVASLAIAVNAYSEPGDSCLIQTPVYPPFFDVVKNNDRELITNPLKLENDRYGIDFEDLEVKLAQKPKLMILCSPHNPVARVWSQEELLRILDLCLTYDVLLISDEIHADLVFSPNKHTMALQLDERYHDHIICCLSPSKTFNLAGLQASVVAIPNKRHRAAFNKYYSRFGLSQLNTLGMTAMATAYGQGADWLDELLTYLAENVRIVEQFIEEELPNVKLIKPEATYLLWLDFSSLELSDDELNQLLLSKGGIAMNAGTSFGSEGSGFMRLNIACPSAVVREGMERIKKAVTSLA